MTKRKGKALVVLSGGQDSVTCLFWAKENFEEVHAVTFDYGQRHKIEIDAAIKTAQMAGVASHEVIVLDNCLKSTSPLTSSNELEKYENHDQMEKVISNRVELTFVPMRNTLFLTVAMNRAYTLGALNLVTGVCQADNANYPDCTERFINSFQFMANESLGLNKEEFSFKAKDLTFKIHTPLMYFSKEESVRFARGLPGCWEALAFSHTSYDGKYPPTDNNHSNVLRAHGFEEAGFPDPLVMRAVMEGLMPLPLTDNYSKFRSNDEK